MTRHTIQVDVGSGLETIEVGETMWLRLATAVRQTRLARQQEATERMKEAFKAAADSAAGWHFVGTTSTGGNVFFGPAGFNPPPMPQSAPPPRRGHSASYSEVDGEPWVDPEQWDAAAPPTPERPRPATPRTANEAFGVLRHSLGGDTQMFSDAKTIRRSVRQAKRATHPDTGGTSADFQLVTAAEAILRADGRI